jgi:hypothetical protein
MINHSVSKVITVKLYSRLSMINHSVSKVITVKLYNRFAWNYLIQGNSFEGFALSHSMELSQTHSSITDSTPILSYVRKS